MNKDDKILVTGARGMVGQALFRVLTEAGFKNLLSAHRPWCDLLSQKQTDDFFALHKPDYVIHAAAKVGGILFHRDNPVSALADNLAINENVIHAAAAHGVEKLLFLGSACAYPKHAGIPVTEGALLGGALESTNEGYALAKIIGIKLCEAYKKQVGKNFISCMPTNLYGPGDHYDLHDSHVLPGMVRRMHEAKLEGQEWVDLWGSGEPTREFLFVDDLARACLVLMEKYNDAQTINVGTGKPVALRQLAWLIQAQTGYTGRLEWDTNKPDGTPRRELDCSKIFKLGWKPEIGLDVGLYVTYQDFVRRYPDKI